MPRWSRLSADCQSPTGHGAASDVALAVCLWLRSVRVAWTRLIIGQVRYGPWIAKVRRVRGPWKLAEVDSEKITYYFLANFFADMAQQADC